MNDNRHPPIVPSLLRYYRIFYRYVGNRFWLFLAMVLLVGVSEGIGLSAFIPLLGLYTPGMVDDPFIKRIYQAAEWLGVDVTLPSLVVLIVVVFVLKTVFVLGQGLVKAHMSVGLVRDLRLGLLASYCRMRYEYFAGTSLGYFNNIMSTEVDRTNGSFLKYTELLSGILYGIICLAFSFMVNWRISIGVLVLGGCAYFVFRGFSSLARSISLDVSRVSAQLHEFFIQFIYHFKYLKATASFREISRKLEDVIESYRWRSFKGQAINLLTPQILQLFAVLLFAGAVQYFVVIQKRPLPLVLGQAFLMYKALTQVLGFQTRWQMFCSKLGGVDMVEEARAALERYSEASGGVPVQGLHSEIRLRDVHVSYGSRQVLFGVNLVIRKNSVVGIVGESGVGKTTVLDMITGLVRPTKGTVEIDGVSYDGVNLDSLRGLFGYITQDPVVFNDTVVNNISLWSHDPGDASDWDRLEHAARVGHCLGFIRETEAGMGTVVGDKGVRLSGGQRQRLSISREIYKRREVLIFDEATSALDSDAEQYIQRSIEDLIGEKTLIIVSHRLSTLRRCHYLYVLRDGGVAEEGTWDELSGRAGSLFSRMCSVQGVGHGDG
jgi:subfamily B ATP-binding cassette protein MsbA